MSCPVCGGHWKRTACIIPSSHICDVLRHHCVGNYDDDDCDFDSGHDDHSGDDDDDVDGDDGEETEVTLIYYKMMMIPW